MSDRVYCVYFHERRDKPGHIFYCGSGNKRRPSQRSKGHRNKYWHNIVEKYGYNIHIIADNLTKEESLCLEGFLIHEWKEVGMCETVFSIPENGEHYVVTDEHRKKCSLANSGESNSVFGKILINNGIEQIYVFPYEVDEYLSKGWFKGMTQNIKRYMGPKDIEAISGGNHHAHSKKWYTDGVHSKMLSIKELASYSGYFEGRIQSGRGVYCYEERMFFSSVQDAMRWLNLKSSAGIRKCLNKPDKSSGGYHWCTDLGILDAETIKFHKTGPKPKSK